MVHVLGVPLSALSPAAILINAHCKRLAQSDSKLWEHNFCLSYKHQFAQKLEIRKIQKYKIGTVRLSHFRGSIKAKEVLAWMLSRCRSIWLRGNQNGSLLFLVWGQKVYWWQDAFRGSGLQTSIATAWEIFAVGENKSSDTVRMYDFENGLIIRSERALDHCMFESKKELK